MKLIKSIYRAPVTDKYYEEIYGTTIVRIKHDGKIFTGLALLSEEDKGFYSKKVGYNIALSKARINALDFYYKQEKRKYAERYLFYQEVMNFGGKPVAEIDPTGSFSKNLMHLQTRVAVIKEVLDKEKKILRTYLEGQDKAIKSIKRFREKE